MEEKRWVPFTDEELKALKPGDPVVYKSPVFGVKEEYIEGNLSYPYIQPTTRKLFLYIDVAGRSGQISPKAENCGKWYVPPERSDIHDILGYDESLLTEGEILDFSGVTDEDLERAEAILKNKGYSVYRWKTYGSELQISETLNLPERSAWNTKLSIRIKLRVGPQKPHSTIGSKKVTKEEPGLEFGATLYSPVASQELGTVKRKFSLATIPRTFKPFTSRHMFADDKRYYTSECARIYSDFLSAFTPPERSDIHDIIGYDESLINEMKPGEMKKELWRTDLLKMLQDVRDPELTIESVTDGVRVIWEDPSHVNYYFWFNLYKSDSPKICINIDPTLSGSTTGWLSTRKLANPKSLVNLPDSVKAWAQEDAKKKNNHPQFRARAKDVLSVGVPRDLESAYQSVRRQLVAPPERGDIHDIIGYDESLLDE
jgi:hypothetical protein